MKSKTVKNTISSRLIQTICERLSQNKQVRRTLPLSGRLHIDRQLPFLCIYRQPLKREDEGTRRLIMGMPSYLYVSGNRQLRQSLSTLIRRVVETLSAEFGAFLILEIWTAPEIDRSDDIDLTVGQPSFRIFTRRRNINAIHPTIEILEKKVKGIRIAKQNARVEIIHSKKIFPTGLSPILSDNEMKEYVCDIIGLEIRPIYRDSETDQILPLVHRALIRQMTSVFQQTFFKFSQNHTNHHAPHYYALGRRAMVKAVREIDRKIAELRSRFSFLLQVTPVNTSASWREFKRRRFDYTPVFYYRPLSIGPDLLKRRLWDIQIERIEGPVLAQLFREKREELDTQITMLANLEKPPFFYGSLQLFGIVDDELINIAKDLLNNLPPRSREDSVKGYVDAKGFARHAVAEIEYYRRSYPEFSAGVEIRDDIPSGLIVAGGKLLIGKETKIPFSRVEALLQHEVGTHLLTYYNGRAQPFHQLYLGLAGYDELQEGLAVLSEYLVGGLSIPRLRVLAARVVACYYLIEGASFIDTFRILNGEYKFEQYTAFTITVRVYRGGGLTKDAIYLRGIKVILDYIKNGGKLDGLFIGKIAAVHIPIIKELQLRKVLKPPPLEPKYIHKPETLEKLESLRKGVPVTELVERSKK